MNNFVIDTPDNFWQIRWLDKYIGDMVRTVIDF